MGSKKTSMKGAEENEFEDLATDSESKKVVEDVAEVNEEMEVYFL